MKKRNKQTGRFEKTGKELVCDYCGKIIYQPIYRLNKNKNHFCSKSCEGKFRVGKLAANFKGGLVEVTCSNIHCENKFLVKPYKVNLNHYCSKKCVNYTHGKGYLGYSREFRNKRAYILYRDYFICQKCNKHQMEIRMTVHHIDYDKENNKENNLIALCDSCNTKVNINRNYWTNFFRKIVLDKRYKEELAERFIQKLEIEI